jgi:hypothetical protein
MVSDIIMGGGIPQIKQLFGVFQKSGISVSRGMTPTSNNS